LAAEAGGIEVILIGIDPGMKGALCKMDHSGTILDIVDMPTLRVGKRKKVTLDYHHLSALILEWRAGHAFVEKVWAMPARRRGVDGKISAEGNTSVLVGVYMAVLATLTTAGVPWTAIAPRTWQVALQVPAGKDGSRGRASQLMPAGARHWRLIKHDGRAESALIGLYGVRLLNAIARRDEKPHTSLSSEEQALE
jgi:hypothetical protein